MFNFLHGVRRHVATLVLVFFTLFGAPSAVAHSLPIALYDLVHSAEAQQEVTVGWLGASTSVGTQPPMGNNTVLAAGDRNFRGGVEYFALHANNSGPQRCFLDRMHELGYGPITLVERGVVGASSDTIRQTHIVRLIEDFATFNLPQADVMILIGGGPDSKVPKDAAQYTARNFGPWQVDFGGVDSSIFAQARSAWDKTYITETEAGLTVDIVTLPIVLATSVQWNGGSLLRGESEDDDVKLHHLIRGLQIVGCAQDENCWPVVTTESDVPLDGNGTNQHPNQLGYCNLGKMLANQTNHAMIGAP